MKGNDSMIGKEIIDSTENMESSENGFIKSIKNAGKIKAVGLSFASITILPSDKALAHLSGLSVAIIVGK